MWDYFTSLQTFKSLSQINKTIKIKHYGKANLENKTLYLQKAQISWYYHDILCYLYHTVLKYIFLYKKIFFNIFLYKKIKRWQFPPKDLIWINEVNDGKGKIIIWLTVENLIAQLWKLTNKHINKYFRTLNVFRKCNQFYFML